MIFKTFALLVLLTTHLGITKRNEKPVTAELVQAFKHDVERLRQELNIPGMSVSVLRKQQVVFARGFGYADIKNEITATENTPYHIASLTKPFAATVLMKLVEEGQLDLDDAMSDILKDAVFPFAFNGNPIHGYASVCEKIKEIGQDESFPLAFLFHDYYSDTERITVRHHLTHTSQGVPGEAYRYNGFLYGWLSLVAEKVSGRRFDELLIEKIIAPLEMARTIPNQSNSQRQQVLAELTKYYRVDDSGNFELSQWPSKEMAEIMKMSGLSASEPDYLNAGAGMVSTVLNLAKFDIAMDRNLIVSEESKEMMFSPTVSKNGQRLPYGMGWFVQEHRGSKIVWHYGWAPDAYSSLILKVPEEEVTLILLANSDDASKSFNLGAGNVLTSPFAVTFISQFTDIEMLLQ